MISPRSIYWLKRSNWASPRIVLPHTAADSARLVPEVGKDGLAMVTDNIDPASRGDGFGALVMGDICVLRLDLTNSMLPVERGGEDDMTLFPDSGTDLVEPCLVEGCVIGGAAHGKYSWGMEGYVS